MKKWGFALTTLGERSGLTIGIFLFILAVAAPFMMPEQIVISPDARHTGAIPIDVLYVLWRETLIVPGYIGLAIGTACAEIRAGTYAWTLPALDRRLFLSACVAMFIVAAVMMSFHILAGDMPVVGFAISCLAFSTGLLGPNTGRPRGAVWLAIVLHHYLLQSRVVSPNRHIFAGHHRRDRDAGRIGIDVC